MIYGQREEVVFRAEAACCSLEIAKQQFAEKKKDIILKGWKIINERIYESPTLIAVHWLAQREKKDETPSPHPGPR